MKKTCFRKKVLMSLLAMSYVYLGGTSALPIAEAATELNGEQNGSNHFTDDIIINFPSPTYHWEAGIHTNSNSDVVTIAPEKTVTINIGGISGDAKANMGIGAWGGTVTLNTVIINSVDVGVLAHGG